MPTIEVMPITMPSTVSPDRSLFVRTVASAMLMTSRARVSLMPGPLLTTERFDRIQPGGAHGRIQTEEQADDGGDADADGDGPRLDLRRNRRQRGNRRRDRRSEQRARDPAERRQRDRFRQHLRHDVAPARAQRLPQADLRRP